MFSLFIYLLINLFILVEAELFFFLGRAFFYVFFFRQSNTENVCIAFFMCYLSFYISGGRVC